MANQDLVFDISKAHLEQINQQLIIGRVGDGGLKVICHVLNAPLIRSSKNNSGKFLGK